MRNQDSNRNDIIVENFFFYLNKNEISQLKYEKDNDLPKGTLSKWKAKSISIGVEQFYQAAKYFDITVNDIFYSYDEKLKITILTNTDYKPIEATRLQDVRVVFSSIKKSYVHISIFSVVSILLFFYLLFNDMIAFYPLISITLSFSFSAVVFIFSPKKTFNFNYLDEVGFIISNNKNENYLIIKIVKFISIIMSIVFLCSILFFFIYDGLGYEGSIFISMFFMFLLGIYMFIYYLVKFFKVNKKYDKIYCDRSDPYKKILFLLYINISILIYSVFLLLIINSIFLIISSSILLLLCLVEYYFVRKKMLKYRYMCRKYDGEIVKLFQK